MRTDEWVFGGHVEDTEAAGRVFLEDGQRRRWAPFSHSSLVVWAATQETRKWELLPGLFSTLWNEPTLDKYPGNEEPSLSFLAHCILG